MVLGPSDHVFRNHIVENHPAYGNVARECCCGFLRASCLLSFTHSYLVYEHVSYEFYIQHYNHLPVVRCPRPSNLAASRLECWCEQTITTTKKVLGNNARSILTVFSLTHHGVCYPSAVGFTWTARLHCHQWQATFLRPTLRCPAMKQQTLRLALRHPPSR